MTVCPPRVVLDTNVCLDLFVFDDPRVPRLRDAMQADEVAAVTNAACRDEWLRVLDYPQLALDTIRREAAIAGFDALMHDWTATGAAPDANTLRAPRCRDRDDQKFLDLALRCGARWLLTRDDHLLALARRVRRDGPCDVLTPVQWIDQVSRRA